MKKILALCMMLGAAALAWKLPKKRYVCIGPEGWV